MHSRLLRNANLWIQICDKFHVKQENLDRYLSHSVTLCTDCVSRETDKLVKLYVSRETFFRLPMTRSAPHAFHDKVLARRPLLAIHDTLFRMEQVSLYSIELKTNPLKSLG